GNILLHLDHRNFSLTEGDIFSLTAQFRPIANLGNPEEFDYRSFMARRGCFLSANLGENSYRIVGHSDDFFSQSLHARRRLVNLVLNSSLSIDAKHLVCTAILGDASITDLATRTTFSQAGIAHMLAISGLHTGIILALLSLLLRPLDRLNLRPLRWALTVVAMALFLFVTGMSASAIRATIMAAVGIAALAWQRDGSALNSLCLAAILILFFSPMSLFSVGFQLSFAAVAAILLLMPRLNAASRRLAVISVIISWAGATLIANVGCAVISAHYFHTLPLISILSNLVVIPVLPLYVATGLIEILCLSLGIELTEINALLQCLTSFINGTATVASHLPFAYIDNLHVPLPMVVLYYLAFALAVTFTNRRSFTAGISFLASCVAILFCIAIDSALTPRQGFFILNNRHSTPLLHFSAGTGRLWCTDSQWSNADFRYSFSNLLAKYRIDSLNIVPTDASVSHSAPSCQGNIRSSVAVMCGKRIVMASHTDLRHLRASRPIACDYLIITNRYYGSIADLLRTFSPDTIVLSGALFADRRQRIAKELPSLPADIKIHDIATRGAIAFTR
ncbi:MAG: ComEC/Rec2 family competence protein, partial [Muribaculaceae bacterium]